MLLRPIQIAQGAASISRNSERQRCFCTASYNVSKLPGMTSRRKIFGLSMLLSSSSLILTPVSSANIVDDYVERSQRPEMTSQQALIKLLDARGILYELRDLAATDPKSQLRFNSRSLLPGMAKTLRQVGKAAPVVIAEISGGDKKSTVSKVYGGKASDLASAKADPVYQAIGQVITISGRTIKNEAQASPEYAVTAIDKINDLLALLPDSAIDEAQQTRKGRRPAKITERNDVSKDYIAR